VSGDTGASSTPTLPFGGAGIGGASALRGAISLGIDVGGTKIHAVAIDERRRVRAEYQQPSGQGESALLESLAHTVNVLVRKVGIGVHDVESIGIGVPGLVDRATGRVRNAVNLGVSDLALGPLLSERLRLPVTLENDVNVAAIGASLVRTPAVGSLAYLNVGTGIAATFTCWADGCGRAHAASPARSATCRSTTTGCSAPADSAAASRPSPRARASPAPGPRRIPCPCSTCSMR
jgi:glucokinase